MLFVLNSCKKNEIIPPPGSSTPVFTAFGTFGSEVIDLRAGDQNTLMETESSILNGVDFFKGSLGNENFKLELGIYGGNFDLPVSSIPEFSNQSIIPFDFLVPQIPLYSIKKDSLPNSEAIIKIEWEVNGVMQPLIDDLEIREPGKYQVCAHVTFDDYSVETICNEVLVGFKSNAALELEFVFGQDHNLMAWIEPKIGQVQSVKWFVDGTFSSDLIQLNKYLENGSHLIQAEVLFTNGVKTLRSVLVDADLDGRNIFDFAETCMIYPFEWDFGSKLKVTKNNMEYFSHITPNNNSHFIVDNVKYYGLNPAGKKVYIIHGNLNVNLKSKTSPTVIPLDLEVSFGISLN